MVDQVVFQDFSCFLMKTCITMNFPLRSSFAEFHRFCKVAFSFSFVSRYFLIYSLISSLNHWVFNIMVFSLHVFILFPFFFLWLISSFTLLCSEKMIEIISISLNLLRLIFWPIVWSILKSIPCVLEKYVYSCFFWI